MKYLFLLIIFIIIFSSCQPTINEKSISVDIGKISSLPPETLFTSARIIPLETTDSSLMAQIDKVLVHKKTIYLLDARQNIVFVFNDNGNFLFKINQKGRGPEEYNFLNDININPYEQTLELLDPMGNLLTFDTTGKFIAKVSLPKEIPAYHKFGYIDREHIAFCCEHNENILSIYSRTSGKITGKYIKNKKNCAIGLPSFYTYNDTTYLSRFLFDQVYCVSKEGPKIAYEWFIPGHDYDPLKTIPDYDRNNFQEFKEVVDNLPCTYYKNWQNQDYLYTAIQIKGKEDCINIFYEKPTGKSTVFDKLEKEISFVADYMDDSTAIGIIQSSEMANYQNLNILDTFSREIIKHYDDVTSNPYLIEYIFK